LALTGLETIHPDKFHVTVKEHPNKTEYRAWLDEFKLKNLSPAGASHTSSPIVWFDDDNYLGGCDDTLAYCRKVFSATVESEAPAPAVDDGFTKEHSYDYDLIVIGGGSGGLACSKEAVKLGAKVAVLDYVKPSPIGSKWGLGGTCVNVGCIPKKLMHNAALLGEHTKDAKGFGWTGLEDASHDWEIMRSNVQDHIKGLNFGYRVQLREKGVTYLNKLGRFTGPHELECTDSKGKTTTITAARFIIAVGGRPSILQCPGGELAMSSDDIFLKDTAPGKTCVVGAGYVALECGGFLSGLSKPGDVSVLVRSIPLRGFDREAVAVITDYMQKGGINIIENVSPHSIVKQPSGKLLVTYGPSSEASSQSEEFDTVLCAIGRYADLAGLDLGKAGMVKVNDRTGKLVCINEQTTVPHIYACGDVIDNAPELTPVAVKAGVLLSQRLFGNSNKTMVYTDIATTVFTPLEFGTVGLNEEDAIAMYGADKVDAYISSFSPLEWTIAEHKEGLSAFCKVVVHKEMDEKVLGMHIVCPNAGEIIQGFAVAYRKGLVYQDLVDTIGIHPTIAEEFCTMSVKKSSGQSAAKAGC
jgi:thioredoxin/glutathione reductase (selenoprotein)